MIRDIMPPWVYPTVPKVQVFDKNKSRYVEGYYCFETQRWKDIKGANISVIGWKHCNIHK
jgi:hypothetical protein